jgi:hypothetical protein
MSAKKDIEHISSADAKHLARFSSSIFTSEEHQEEGVHKPEPIVNLECKVTNPKSLVNIVFSFDTTGSMSPIIESVRQNLSETIVRLFKEIEGIHIGMIAHGDYCDYRRGSFAWTLNPSDDVEAVKKFVQTAHRTGGGDPEECYELALKLASEMKWTSDVRVLVIIGDQVPHEVGYKLNTGIPGFSDTLNVDWRQMLNLLKEQKVSIFGCHALASRNRSCDYFYKTISNMTNGLYITMDELGSFPDFMVGICMKAADGAEDYQILLHHQQDLLEKKKTANSEEERIQLDRELCDTRQALTSAQKDTVFSSQVRERAKQARLYYSSGHSLDSQPGAGTRSERFRTEVKAKKPVSSTLDKFLTQISSD